MRSQNARNGRRLGRRRRSRNATTSHQAAKGRRAAIWARASTAASWGIGRPPVRTGLPSATCATRLATSRQIARIRMPKRRTTRTWRHVRRRSSGRKMSSGRNKGNTASDKQQSPAEDEYRGSSRDHGQEGREGAGHSTTFYGSPTVDGLSKRSSGSADGRKNQGRDGRNEETDGGDVHDVERADE